MARIENHKYTIEQAFRECFYVVPDYQREYIWSEKEVHRLLQDIDEEFDVGDRREYFIGTVLVSPTTQMGHFEVIDGQQRLTTFFLLLCALRQRFKGQPQYPLLTGLLSTSYADAGGNLKTSLKLEPRYEHAGELMSRIVAIDADPLTTKAKVSAAGIPKFGSLDRLLGAYAAIHTFFDSNYKDFDALRKYFGYLANNVVFIQISADVSSALKIFETINERGVGLNSMDLLKNLLFTQVKPDEFTRLRDEWKKITGPLERHKEKPLRFLRYFIMANYRVKNERRDGVVREDEIYDWLIDKENAELCGYRSDPFGFVRKITRSVEQYIGFTEGRGNDGVASVTMDTLQQLCGAAFSLHYVLLLACAGFPKSLFDHFVRQLESFLFYYIFTKTPTKDLERSFSIWADELREIGEIADAKTQKQRLNEFVEERLQKNMAGKEAELGDTLRRYTLGSMQQYRTRYLLAKFAQHVEMAFRGIREPGSLSEFTALQIEHILPDTPEANLRQSFTTANPGKSYDEYKARLGNLTLLEMPINIVASNGFFEKKKNEYAKSGNYLTRSIVALSPVGKNTTITRINEQLRAFDNWSALDIEQRQDMLIALSKDIWRTTKIDVS
ncbi:DUF262 domain-containing protein [Rhodopseudomonas palustris]|uniref:DUF262 domain-containing protein n=1 Tax=Rhodopseudomonas palustris TaxID=1076 RepID=UPI0021F368B8|nr:DUF262 domain-containing HNH endonuclease family protein [Rhodopseudomonas palustris]UYO55812.1 DUF262 domain-containing HNH endonuclease family protein [Rhodopseudomonas palustris]